MHAFSVQINTRKDSSDGNHKKLKGTVKTTSHNCCSIITATFLSLTRHRYRKQLEYALHLFSIQTSCSRSLRVPSSPFRIGFAWLEMKKSSQEREKKLPGVLSLVDFLNQGTKTHMHTIDCIQLLRYVAAEPSTAFDSGIYMMRMKYF